jgi:[ribosomal protein S18]-alanine N-acetyltransferase
MTAGLRPMRWWDIPEAARMERELFAQDPWSEAGFWSELAGVPATRYYVVAEESGAGAGGDPDDAAVVGYAGLLTVGPEADVQTVAVRPDRQGQGLGALLTERLVEEARARGCAQVLLEVREGNSKALRLYERLGFTSIARRAGYYGPGHDAVVMRRRLRAGEP